MMILIDAHVHVYGCYQMEAVFAAAYKNFAREAETHEAGKHFTGVLLLAETAREHQFDALARLADMGSAVKGQGGDWMVRRTKEPCSLHIQSAKGQELFLVSGRQVVTAEKLEVLALLSEKTFPNGRFLKKVVQDISVGGGVPVLSWGFGKWIGKRSTAVLQAIDQSDNGLFFLGDSRGRPRELPEPKPFRLGRDNGMKILAGTDPLPFKGQEAVVGSFGVLIKGEVNPQLPAAGISDLLHASGPDLLMYGRRMGTIGCLRCQSRILLNPWKTKMDLS